MSYPRRAGREVATTSSPAIVVEGLMLLAGIYTAVSPWVIHFYRTNPYLTANNLIMGLGVALLALGTPLAPQRMHRFAWTLVPLGFWLILSPAVVTASHGVSAGIVWSNTCTGGAVCLLGVIAANRAPDSSG
ncbi:SPW repeat-containing protein [Streptomyces puniciscabiei]|uniref:SPW repeat-containing protein n=1 Tax=Streptomyces puniciscabiei TaxID=164348 RepID=A0A542U8X7_9ACTN|nr:SPW repeat protein [Streptomyces puniciscabiei]TQK95512.1 SPW repeat-containing protein [Streptomyces puniciscabiei]